MAGRPVVLLIGPQAQRAERFLRERLSDLAEVRAVPTFDLETLRPHLREAQAVVTPKFTPEMAEAAPALRFLQVHTAGFEGIALDALPEGVLVANAYAHEDACAELALLFMLALTRKLCVVDRGLRQGRWRTSWAGDGVYSDEMTRKTVGILGFGRIGQEVARRARAFKMRLLAVTRNPDPTRAIEWGLAFLGGLQDLERLLRESDYLVIALPLTPQTRGLVGERELRQMKPTAFLINVARAQIVDEAALYRALKEGWIAGAGLDVWYHYPRGTEEPEYPSRYPFHELDNVVLTPHIGGWTRRAMERRWREIAENIRRFLQGLPVRNLVWS